MTTTEANGLVGRLERAALAPVDAASLSAFRVGIGLLGAFGAARFLWNGWVDAFFVQPSFFFKYRFFEWVPVLPEPWMTALVALVLVSGLAVALGIAWRPASIAFFCAFTWVELADVTNYLNHYYLVSLLAGLFVVLPLHRHASIDARLGRRRGSPAGDTGPWRAWHPRWMLWLLRVQVGVVYVHAALAKATTDWLVHAQPLNIWLQARIDTPVIGGFFDAWWVAFVMSWAGFLNDLLIVPALLWRRTRAGAYAVLVGFHLMTGLLFDIGMFPYIMIVAATIFFSPSWPRTLAARARRVRDRVLGPSRTVPDAAPPSIGPESPGASAPPTHRLVSRGVRVALLLALVWASLQVVVPLRAHLYGGNWVWHEQGMRWSWRVMCREKSGSVSYRVRWDGLAYDKRVQPSRYLTRQQEREMSGQPDLILQLGHRIGRDLRADGRRGVEVRVDAIVSLNGRAPAPLVDPDVDLMTLDDGFGRATWILPAPDEPPPRLESRRRGR